MFSGKICFQESRQGDDSLGIRKIAFFSNDWKHQDLKRKCCSLSPVALQTKETPFLCRGGSRVFFFFDRFAWLMWYTVYDGMILYNPFVWSFVAIEVVLDRVCVAHAAVPLSSTAYFSVQYCTLCALLFGKCAVLNVCCIEIWRVPL